MIVFGLSLALVTYTYFVAISRLPITIALVIQFSASAWMTPGEAIWRRLIPSMYVLSAIIVMLGGVILNFHIAIGYTKLAPTKKET